MRFLLPHPLSFCGSGNVTSCSTPLPPTPTSPSCLPPPLPPIMAVRTRDATQTTLGQTVQSAKGGQYLKEISSPASNSSTNTGCLLVGLLWNSACQKDVGRRNWRVSCLMCMCSRRTVLSVHPPIRPPPPPQSTHLSEFKTKTNYNAHFHSTLPFVVFFAPEAESLGFSPRLTRLGSELQICKSTRSKRSTNRGKKKKKTKHEQCRPYNTDALLVITFGSSNIRNNY